MYLEISNPMDYHAGLYIRLSKEDESEGPSQSVQNQESLLREFVQQHRLSVYDTYIDDGWSGTNFDRPAFQRMIADIEAKKVNMVITKDLSRLGRDYILTGHYMERYFPEHRVRYISLLDGIDTGVDSTANDITPFRAIMNDMYAKDISKKIKSVKRDKQRKGQFIGGKPVYGYKMHPTEKNKIVIDEEVAPIVRRIFALALSGMSCRNIATLLNQEGVPTPQPSRGSPGGKTRSLHRLWSSERISDMLQNETYIGNMVQGRCVKISYKSKKCLKQNPANWVVVEGTHEPLVDRETFQKVRMLVNSRRHTRSRTYDFLLKGLIFCHECGYPLTVLNRKKLQGRGCAVLRLPHLSTVHQGWGLHLPFHQGENGDRCSDRQGAGGVPGVSEPRRAAARGTGSCGECQKAEQPGDRTPGPPIQDRQPHRQSGPDVYRPTQRAAARGGLPAHLRPDQAGTGADGGETAGVGAASKKPCPQ